MQREKLRPTELPAIPGFELVRKLGRGGMGEVFEAVRLGSGGFRKPVALKTLNPGLESKALERFLNEARISAQLEHPNIVRVYDLLTVGSRYYLVMELLRGGVVSMLHEPRGGPPWLALSVADQALAGLAYAHAFADPSGRPLGLIHRDLTPRNLFVCDSGTVKILDFGLAKLKDAAALGLTQEGMVAGTPAYLSPEQANGQRIDARTDLYQLGATLYELLAGQPPHGGNSLHEQISHARLGAVTPLAQLRADLPPGLVALVERALARNPGERFPDAQAMREAVLAELARCEQRGPEALARRVAALPPPGRSSGARPRLDGRAVTAPEMMALGSESDRATLPGADAIRSQVSAGPGDPALPRDALVAGRYRIERLVAEGGMGAVYEAEDLELKERVALKTIRPELAGDERAVERFKREIHLARRVTHPNICRIFDIGFHPADPGAAPAGERTIFFTMELVQGETLAQRLRRQGRLTPDEALPIVTQLALGLAAAHRAGVVHGDFKPENVLLEPPREGLPHGRAVITDFGLARAGAGGEGQTAAPLAGTPGYVSPEQVQGGTVTSTSDIYALGVVLYELLAGEPPFTGESPMAVALARVRQPPPAPGAKVPGLDPAWEETILRCLERDPARRFQDAEEVVISLGVEVTVSSSTRLSAVPAGARPATGAAARWAKLRPGLLLVALVLVILLAGGLVWQQRNLQAGRAGGPGPSKVKVRRSVAVLGFQNLSGRQEADWLSTALSEMLGEELGAGGDLRTIPGEDVSRAKVELSVTDPGNLGEQSLQHLGTNLGANLLLSGAYLALGPKAGGKLRLDMQVRDTAHGEVLAKVSATGTETELLELISRTGAELREQLGLSRLSTSQLREVESTLPQHPDATRLYAEGLVRFRASDYVGARELLEQAAAADPNHPLVRSALAATWISIGDKVKARESARQALALSGKLSGRDRLWVEGLAHEAADEWDAAIRSYQALWASAPDDVDVGLRLGEVQLQSGRGPDPAQKTVAALRALPPPASEDPRIDLLEARTLQAASDFKRELPVAARAAARAEKLGARLLVAKARRCEAWALTVQGDNAGALAAYEEARRICEAADQKDCVAGTLEGIGLVRSDMGDMQGAKERLEEALALRRQVGALTSQLTTLNNLALVLAPMGDLAGARHAHETALELARRLGSRIMEAYALVNLADLFRQEGNLPASARYYEQAVVILREGKDSRGEAECLRGLGLIRFQQGDPARGEALLDDALAKLRGLNVKEGVTSLLADLGDVQRLRGEQAAARKTQNDLLALANQLGDRVGAAKARVGLAELALDEAHAAEAEVLARQGAEEFSAQKVPASEAHARDVLALALMAQRKLPEARAEIAAAEGLYRKEADLFGRAAHRIAAARVAGAADPGRVARGLEAQLADFSRMGQVPLEYEARLALGELELAGGRAASGKKRLKALVKDAKAHQLQLLARKASARL